MPESDSVGNRRGNHYNIDKLGGLCEANKKSILWILIASFFMLHPVEQLNQKLEKQIQNNTKAVWYDYANLKLYLIAIVISDYKYK